MITVGVRGNAIFGKVVTQCQTFIVVASPARDQRNAQGVDWRSCLMRFEDKVFAVAIAANGSILHAGFHRFPMHAFKVCPGNLRMALPAS